MSVTRRKVNGEKVWVIDRRFKGPGATERYRRAAQVQSKPAAEVEERRIIDYWTTNGTIKPLLVPAPKAEPEPVDEAKRWEDAVEHFKRVELPKKKPSTRHGYNAALKGPAFLRWAKVPLDEITRQAVNEWDTTLIRTGISDSTRRNQHIVLRSVMKSVGPEGTAWLDDFPRFPRLPSVGQAPVVAIPVDDLLLILSEGEHGKVKYCQMDAIRAAQLAFALAAYGGLRAGEVRALRRRDVDLDQRVLTVRVARSVGEEAAPKSGDSRKIPIADVLYERLEARCRGLNPDDHVSVMGSGRPWNDQGILAALKRACARLKLSKSRYHGLRHFFATTVSKGTDVRIVQGLLGHGSMSVTQRYVHYDADRARDAMMVFGRSLKIAAE